MIHLCEISTCFNGACKPVTVLSLFVKSSNPSLTPTVGANEFLHIEFNQFDVGIWLSVLRKFKSLPIITFWILQSLVE